MSKYIKLNEKSEMHVALFYGLKSNNNASLNEDDKIYMESLYTDGDLIISDVMEINRNDNTDIDDEEINKKTKYIFQKYQNIDRIQLIDLILRKPTHYIKMSIEKKYGKTGKYYSEFYSLMDLSEYIVPSCNEISKKNMQRTLQDIRSLIKDGDISIFELFLSKNHVFRLDYRKVCDGIYQLSSGKIK